VSIERWTVEGAGDLRGSVRLTLDSSRCVRTGEVRSVVENRVLDLAVARVGDPFGCNNVLELWPLTEAPAVRSTELARALLCEEDARTFAAATAFESTNVAERTADSSWRRVTAVGGWLACLGSCGR
jgi:hypothetical protein